MEPERTLSRFRQVSGVCEASVEWALAQSTLRHRVGTGQGDCGGAGNPSGACRHPQPVTFSDDFAIADVSQLGSHNSIRHNCFAWRFENPLAWGFTTLPSVWAYRVARSALTR
jgi:hypothetical protein